MDTNNGLNQNSKEISDFQIKHATLNVRGINDKEKRRRIFQWCKSQNLDIIFLQETFLTAQKQTEATKDWNGYSIHEVSRSNHSNGLSILFRKHLNIEIINSHTSQDGRILLLNTKLNTEYLTLINIYGPSTNETAKKSFFNKCIKWVNEYAFDSNYLIMAGDFNCIDNQNDRYSRIIDLSSNTFKKMKNRLSLTDIWRKLHPESIAYTYIHPTDFTKQSRIDVCLLSNVLSNLVQSCEIKPAPTPDHNAVITTLEKLGRKRGTNIWKLNVDVLKEIDYRIGIEQLFDETCSEFGNTLSKMKLWDLVKFRIKAFSIKYCSNRKKHHDKEYKELEERLLFLETQITHVDDTNNNIYAERANLKQKMNKLMEQKARGHYIRSRAKWVEDGERSNSYFLRLERKRQTFNRIDSLKNENGERVTEDNKILEAAVHFYTKLYSTNNPNEHDINEYLSNIQDIPKLTDNDKVECDKEISYAEIQAALKILKTNKSPGIDGLPGEFYQTFWYLIGELIMDVYRESLDNKELPVSMKTSILSPIFKKNNRENLQNYRPLSLTTTDYEI